MRVLVATTAGGGHFGPLVPFAQAAVQAGHEVLVAAPESFAPAVERAGFAHYGFPDAPQEQLEGVFAGLAGLSNEEGNLIVVRDVFGLIDTRAALPGVEALVDRWRPHLVLRESCEFSSYIVAEAAGIPHAHVAVGLASFGDFALPVLEGPLTELGAEPGLVGLATAPTLTLVPESLEGRALPRVMRFRDEAGEERTEPLPDWWSGSSEPLVYVTFGTVAAGLGLFPGFYLDVIAAVSDLPVRLLLTVGDAADPDALGTVPPNVHVERWWPQRAVMPHAAAMVGHGGFGTTLLGLASGVPMVVVPLFADQPHNAHRVEAIGAGIVLEGRSAALGGLAGALHRLLDDRSYRTEARRVADEIAQLPPPSASVPFLEQLAG